MHVLTSMKVLRYSYVYHKMMRLIGMYNHLDESDRFRIVNKIVATFIQAMEYHPKASSNEGVGSIHSQQPHNVTPRDELNSLDKINAEDMILIAVELLHEARLYDQTVFNPVNF